jgi:hypothetical protein
MAEGADHPMAIAMQWVARVFAATLMMILPGLGGHWLDRRWGIGFLGLAGFVLGLSGGVAYLIAVTRAADAARLAKTRDAQTPDVQVGDGNIRNDEPRERDGDEPRSFGQ